MKEDDDRWVYVPPVPNVFTVFPGKSFFFLVFGFLALAVDTMAPDS